MGNNRQAVIQADTVIKGEIRNCRQIEIHGYVEGQLSAESVLIHESGTFYGTVRTDRAEILGSLQGEVFVRNLINIRSSGSVNGNVQYGQLAMEMGGNLSAELRNCPPTLAGDLNISVRRGSSVTITTEDLTAFDPDDGADALTYTISNVRSGHLALSGSSKTPIAKFSQSDIEAGRVIFVHDGSAGPLASFDAIVADDDGATSGVAQTVTVTVVGV
jgi:cytoskeletal protein CcmA (bactofilin family)